VPAAGKRRRQPGRQHAIPCGYPPAYCPATSARRRHCVSCRGESVARWRGLGRIPNHDTRIAVSRDRAVRCSAWLC
jgi:hypothetical protein